MSGKLFLNFLCLLSLLIIALWPLSAAANETDYNGIEHLGELKFISGMNLAWLDFARDLDQFNQQRFAQALDQIAEAGGNAVRWWLHVNASSSPVFEGDKVSGIDRENIFNLQKALDMAAERNMVLIPVLFSFDLLQDQYGVDQQRNLKLVEDPVYTEAYIEKALLPLVNAVKGHPALLAWEICNEPEGMTREYGWTPVRTDMQHVQQFVNLLTGAIKRADPDVLVTNGSWNFRVLTDIGNMYNYYRDDRLIEAGGDPDGILDFYQVHYYPEHFRERTSPFHNPAEHWQLDKPILIGEFSAKGIIDRGSGFRPAAELTTEQAYRFALENGYAGALAWTWTNHDGHGGVSDAAPGMSLIRELKPEVAFDLPQIQLSPQIVEEISSQRIDTTDETGYISFDLKQVFYDEKDGTELDFLAESSNPDLMQVRLAEDGLLKIDYTPAQRGKSQIEVSAENSSGRITRHRFTLHLVDPDTGDLALLRPVQASSVEDEEIRKPENINDGHNDTRWSSEYEDNQWIYVDLEEKREVVRVALNWETAYARVYEIQVSDDAENWQTVHREENGRGGIEVISFGPVKARYVKLALLERATQWGFSLWEMQVQGPRR